MNAPIVHVSMTGAANLASVRAGLERAGAVPVITADPRDIAAADLAILPGVGAFGPAMEKLSRTGLAEAFRKRWRAGLPVMGICLGMQLFFEGSDEAPGVPGLGLMSGIIGKFGVDLPLPQLGWNRVAADPVADPASGKPAGADALVKDGWAYFANSYRWVPDVGGDKGGDKCGDKCGDFRIPGFRTSRSRYGEEFLASAESDDGRILLCQFHPELSGPWGASLIARWIEANR